MSAGNYAPLPQRLDRLRGAAEELLGALAAEQKRVVFTGEFERGVFAVAVSNARVCADACGFLAEVARRRDG
jgi:hypothetical protein